MGISTYTPTGIPHTTSVDFSKRGINQPVHIVQYDRSLPILAVNLYNNGQLYRLPNDMEVKIRLGKPDKTFVYNRALGCNNDRTIVYFQITQQMTLFHGEFYPVIELMTPEGDIANSSSIYIQVDKNPIQHDYIESTIEYKELIDYRNEAVTSAEIAKQAIGASEVAVEKAEQASQSANSAQESANLAQESANLAQESANLAQESANSIVGVEERVTTLKNETVNAQTKAAESETNAKQSEERAIIAETNAKQSEERAIIAETNAKQSEERASKSAQLANTCAEITKSKAFQCAESAESAAQFATSAENSATEAKKSAESAAELYETVRGEIGNATLDTEAILGKIGDLTQLQTNDKSNTVNAINEVFCLGNEKKAKLVENLIAMGITASTSESWESLLSKVLTIFTGTDVSDTSAIASHVLETDYFYDASGVRTKGTMIDRSCVNGHELDIVNPQYPRQSIHDYKVSSAQYGNWGANENREGFLVPAPTGYFNNYDGGDLSYIYLPGSVVRSQLKITSDKIVEGNKICNVEGTAKLGKKFASGTISVANISDLPYQDYDTHVIKEQKYTVASFYYFTLTLDFIPSIIVAGLYSGSNTINKTTCLNDGEYRSTYVNQGDFNVNVNIDKTTNVPIFFRSGFMSTDRIEWVAYE